MTDINRRAGTAFTIAAYLVWGLLPLYWKALHLVPPFQILVHRILWCFLILCLLLTVSRGWPSVRAVLMSRKKRNLCLLTAVIIGANWLTYIWAINSNHIVETSLGYYINPLLSVLLGVVFLKERLNIWAKIAFGLAFAGVAYQTLEFGRFPWIAFTLALTFGVYGLLRKISGIGSLTGLAVETAVLSPLAVFFIFSREISGRGIFLGRGPLLPLLLVGAGMMTAVPMLLFVSGVRRIPLSTAGFIQYLAPTMQLLIGVLIYREPFGRGQFISFGLIWCALFIFTLFSIKGPREKTNNVLTNTDAVSYK